MVGEIVIKMVEEKRFGKMIIDVFKDIPKDTTGSLSKK
jgi:hypothetical protein